MNWPALGNLKASITKLEEATKARTATLKAFGMGGEARVAGPGEYVVKPGDTGTKIAKTVGVSIADLEAANPGIDWRRLRVGQTIKTRDKSPVMSAEGDTATATRPDTKDSRPESSDEFINRVLRPTPDK